MKATDWNIPIYSVILPSKRGRHKQEKLRCKDFIMAEKNFPWLALP
jgi:hypothetical protein